MKSTNSFQLDHQKISGRSLLVIMVLVIGFQVSFGQESTLDNYTGTWIDNVSWVDNTSPGTTIDGVDINVFGNITLTEKKWIQISLLSIPA